MKILFAFAFAGLVAGAAGCGHKQAAKTETPATTQPASDAAAAPAAPAAPAAAPADRPPPN